MEKVHKKLCDSKFAKLDFSYGTVYAVVSQGFLDKYSDTGWSWYCTSEDDCIKVANNYKEQGMRIRIFDSEGYEYFIDSISSPVEKLNRVYIDEDRKLHLYYIL